MAFEADEMRPGHALLPLRPPSSKHPLPEAILDEDIVILGRKGRGKTYCSMGLAAHLVRTGRQVIVIDPLSVWHGLRYSRDLTEPGVPLLHFGDGEADVAIDGRMGEAVARIMLACKHSAIVDVAHLLREEQVLFMSPFLGELFYKKRKETDPLWLVLEEADEFAPQAAGEMRPVLEQIRRIPRQGRVRGFRIITVTQRAATVNKNLISQLSTLITFQLIAPQDVRTLEAWLDNYGDARGREQVLATVKQLDVGEAWVWSPQLGFLRRVKFPPNDTWDSTRTPEARIDNTPPPPIEPEVINKIREAMARFMGGDPFDEPTEAPRRGRKPAAGPCKPFGPAIRAARIRAKLTQVQLAQRMSTDPTYIARLEAGRGNPSFHVLDKVAQATEQELLIAFSYRPPIEGGRLK